MWWPNKVQVSFIILFLSFQFGCFAQKTKLEKQCVAFWNVENLYDTINDPLTDDDEFLPQGKNQWNAKRYANKLAHLATVISEIGKEEVKNGPALIGLAEVENTAVLNDLIKQKALANRNYKIIHLDGPDRRGVDVALLYKADIFKHGQTKTYTLHLAEDKDFETRQQLVVSGLLQGEKTTIIVAHWPSRRGGAEGSQHKRIAAAELGRKIIDSLLTQDAQSKIIYMGDLNDDPADVSVHQYLFATEKKESLTKAFFNPMFTLHRMGEGTLSYQQKWNLFDQILLSYAWMNDDFNRYQFLSAHIFKPDYLQETEEKYKGQPFRTYAGAKYLGGYSDHFPVYAFFARQLKTGKSK